MTSSKRLLRTGFLSTLSLACIALSGTSAANAQAERKSPMASPSAASGARIDSGRHKPLREQIPCQKTGQAACANSQIKTGSSTPAPAVEKPAAGKTADTPK